MRAQESRQCDQVGLRATCKEMDVGSAPQAVFFDINADAVLNNSDKISGSPAGGIGFTSIPNSPIFVGNVMLISFDDATTSSIWTSGSTGALVRESWREFISP